MKVDIVIDFYKRFDLWPLVAWGLDQNHEQINRIYLVNDGLWDLNEIDALTDRVEKCVVIPLDHERKGIRPQLSIKQGAESVNTEYFCHIDSDIVLKPGSLLENFEHIDKEFIVYGRAHDVSERTPVASLPDPHIERPDWRIQPHNMNGELYKMCRDSYWIAPTQDYLNVGHDTTFPGYGCVDWDFACRWMMKHGQDSWMIGPGESYHVGGATRRHESQETNVAKFLETARKYTAMFHE